MLTGISHESSGLHYEFQNMLAQTSKTAKRRVRMQSSNHRFLDYGGMWTDVAKNAGWGGGDLGDAIRFLVQKAGITTATGITNYSLDLGLMGLYPNETPLLDSIPRKISHKGDVMTHWKTITNPDQFNVAMGVAEGQRTSSVTPIVNLVSRAYATLGKESNYTFEAEEAAEGFDNLPSQDSIQLMNSFRIGESKVAGYSNATYPLGTAPTATIAVASPTPSPTPTLPSATYLVRVVALTFDGLQQASVSGGVATTSTRNNNDGTTTTIPGGSSIASVASSTQAITVGQGLTATVTPPSTPVYGYAWYIGTTAGNAALAAITTLPTYTFVAAAAGTQTAASVTVDNSVNALQYDGLATQLIGTGAAQLNLNCGTLTQDGTGGVSQFANAFVALAETYKLGIDTLWCGYGVKQAILQAAFGSTGPVYRIDMGPGTTNVLGNDVDFILNQYTGQKIRLALDPWAPSNFAFGVSNRLPYKLPDVPLPYWIEVRMRDYYQIDWPVTTRNKYFGIYYSGVMKVPAPFAGVVFGGINTTSTYVAP